MYSNLTTMDINPYVNERSLEFRVLYLVRNFVMAQYGNVYVAEHHRADSNNSRMETVQKLSLAAFKDYPVVVDNLTPNEMDELGFGFSKKQQGVRIIPVWVFPFMRKGQEVICAETGKPIWFNASVTLRRNQANFGFLGYGVYGKQPLKTGMETGKRKVDLND